MDANAFSAATETRALIVITLNTKEYQSYTSRARLINLQIIFTRTRLSRLDYSVHIDRTSLNSFYATSRLILPIVMLKSRDDDDFEDDHDFQLDEDVKVRNCDCHEATVTVAIAKY